MQKKTYLKIIFILSILFAIIYLNNTLTSHASHYVSSQAMIRCNNLIHQECLLTTQNQTKLSIQFDQEPTALNKFKIRLKTQSGIAIQHVTASFQMKDMDMGFNLFQFKHIVLKQIDNNLNKTKLIHHEWLTDAILPVCTNYRHDWILILKITYSDQKEDVGYITFETKH